MAREIQVTVYTFYKITWSAIHYTLPVRQFPNCLINELPSLYWNTKITAIKGEGQDKGTFFPFPNIYTIQWCWWGWKYSVKKELNQSTQHHIPKTWILKLQTVINLLYYLTTSHQSDSNIFFNPWFPNTLNSDKLQLSYKRMRRHSSHSVPYKVCQTSGCHDNSHFG